MAAGEASSKVSADLSDFDEIRTSTTSAAVKTLTTIISSAGTLKARHDGELKPDIANDNEASHSLGSHGKQKRLDVANPFSTAIHHPTSTGKAASPAATTNAPLTDMTSNKNAMETSLSTFWISVAIGSASLLLSLTFVVINVWRAGVAFLPIIEIMLAIWAGHQAGMFIAENGPTDMKNVASCAILGVFWAITFSLVSSLDHKTLACCPVTIGRRFADTIKFLSLGCKKNSFEAGKWQHSSLLGQLGWNCYRLGSGGMARKGGTVGANTW